MNALNPFLVVLAALPVLFVGYAYAGYPVILWMLTRTRRASTQPEEPVEWPTITITLPCYNEERRIRAALDAILATTYPPDRRQILVISDASSDRTDEIAREYARQGVELLRLPHRQGKSAAENAGARAARGEILVNTDASVRILPNSLKPLVVAFQDQSVGVASGRDLSVGHADAHETRAEAGYVGYEMWVRSLETRVGSIVGASGCFFGIRRHVNDASFPEGLSRDFASALLAWEHGLRAVSVEDAICVVPRTASLHTEVQRKVRTMARGLETLWYKRHLMNPIAHGAFAWMLISHKLCRWLVYAALPMSVVAILVLAASFWWARAIVVLLLCGTILGTIGMRWPRNKEVPSIFGVCAFALATQVAGLLAWRKVLRGDHTAMWEPTRRPA
jgi:glycosyltransferase involved in cell wall biosynthesis